MSIVVKRSIKKAYRQLCRIGEFEAARLILELLIYGDVRLYSDVDHDSYIAECALMSIRGIGYERAYNHRSSYFWYFTN